MNKLITNPPIPFVMTIPDGPLQPGHVILLHGIPLKAANRFCFNLVSQNNMKCVFHLDFRFDQGQTVLNCELPSGWGSEERSSLPVVKRNNFQCEIRVVHDRVLVAINGRHFCDFNHRVSISMADTLQIKGDVTITRIQFKREAVFPSAPPPKQLNVQNPSIPFVSYTNGPIREGNELFIQGKVKPVTDRFHVNLQQGAQLYPHPTIAFHFNPRFGGTNAIIMNSYIGNWGNEERVSHLMPFKPNMDFALGIKRQNFGYEVSVNGNRLAVYNHRISPDIVDTVSIDGDVVIYKVMVL